MSLDKAIAHGKEHRKPYYRSGKWDRTCRPNGKCAWCRDNRRIGDLKRADQTRESQEAPHTQEAK